MPCPKCPPWDLCSRCKAIRNALQTPEGRASLVKAKRPRKGAHLYIVQQHTTGAIKVGRTSNINRRLKELLTGSPYRLKCLLLVKNQGNLERRIHTRLRDYKSRTSEGEWFTCECLPSLPDWMYEQIDMEDADSWWLSDQ